MRKEHRFILFAAIMIISYMLLQNQNVIVAIALAVAAMGFAYGVWGLYVYLNRHSNGNPPLA